MVNPLQKSLDYTGGLITAVGMVILLFFAYCGDYQTAYRIGAITVGLIFVNIIVHLWKARQNG